MKPSSPSCPSRPSLNNSSDPSGETALDDGANPLRRHTPNNVASAKSPRSVRFIAPSTNDSGDERGDGRISGTISPSGSFIATDHDGGDLLLHVTNPSPGSRDDLPPFRLTREDVEAAFEFLDVNASGVLTMSNLKQRLSAFYPQLTSKEYKFLVEDPSGNNAVCSVGGQASGAEVSAVSLQTFASPFEAEGPKANGVHASPSPLQQQGKGVPNDSLRAGGTHTEMSSSPAELATGHGNRGNTGTMGGGRAYGSRAGLDVDQLWDLIQSFQHLCSSLDGANGAGLGAAPAAVHRSNGASGGPRHHGNPGGPNSPYDVNVAASLLHGEAASFDAVGEAFHVYDPHNTHYVEKEVLSRIMAQAGFGELNEEDLTLLVGTADFDGDGRISLDDFRRLVSMRGRFKKT